MYFQASRHHNNPGFTLVELMVVMMIAGAAIGLVAPKLIGAYDKIRAAAEEQKLIDIIETVKMRSFIRQIPYTIEFADNGLKVGDENNEISFAFIRFQPAAITFNGNGFPDADGLKYSVRGVEKVLHVS